MTHQQIKYMNKPLLWSQEWEDKQRKYIRSSRYNKLLHFKVRFRFNRHYTKHMTLCGTEQEEYISRNSFVLMKPDKQCKRCSDFAKTIRGQEIEIKDISTNEKIIDLADFQELFTLSQVRSFCARNGLFFSLHKPEMSYWDKIKLNRKG